MAKVLIIRLSSIGDVAMTIPVVYSLAQAYPDDEFTVLTQPFLKSLFINCPENLQLIGLDIKGNEKKLSGLLRFTSSLVAHHYDKVIDLHDAIRTKIIRTYFLFFRVPVYVIRRNTQERKKLTIKKNKILKPLITRIDLYMETFARAGYHFNLTFNFLPGISKANLPRLFSFTGEREGKWIGIAPFAKHKGKVYPVDKMEKVVKNLSQSKDITIFLFGGGGDEKQILEQWEQTYPQVKSVVGRFSLAEELALIAQLDVLVSMDSANMHFASLVGTRVVSIWGATHPYAGFYGYNQDPADIIQSDLCCRPCSIYGNKPCYRGDWACMQQIKPDSISDKITSLVNNTI